MRDLTVCYNNSANRGDCNIRKKNNLENENEKPLRSILIVFMDRYRQSGGTLIVKKSWFFALTNHQIVLNTTIQINRNKFY
jgi:hypothetical protein